ncbi:MAG: phosphoribosylaminoimidazolesuccinocarboxamide synthase [Acidobacteriota bacterium]|jgi:phosphoribosylaminoimidazole-succinocarboxamide synthase
MSEQGKVVTSTDIPGVELARRGKVRDVYDLGDELLIVATDRVSAFDVVLPNGIPYKGSVLTQISRFWFDRVTSCPNHLISTEVGDFPEPLQQHADVLAGRSMLVRRADRVDIECVVRGYLIGSGWKDYQATGAVCGIELPADMPMAGRIEEPIFTPASKADDGHDENISFDTMVDMVGREVAEKLRDLSLSIYAEGRAYAEQRGIIIADTKFEFGFIDGELALIDELLTPDSSRFWPADQYRSGVSPPSFDKQFVRDYLSTLDWDKTPPGPELPQDVVDATAAKYLEAYEQLTGVALPGAGG